MRGVSFCIILVISLWGAGQVCSNSESCGRRSAISKIKRVIGGSNALRGSWPWQVDILRQKTDTDPFISYCGGTLISDTWVLTAAHCVFYIPDATRYKVVLGQYDRSTMDPSEQEYDVASIRIHEEYMTRGYSFDIALLKLASPAQLVPGRVSVACLPRQGIRVKAGTECFITGWGRTSSSEKSNILQEAKMPVVDYNACVAGNSKLTYASVDNETMLCAGYGGDSVVTGCHGDGGGPFVCEESGSWVLRGVGSWGDHHCGGGPTFSVFALVSSFVDWIHVTMNKPDFVPDEQTCQDYLPPKRCAELIEKGSCSNGWMENYLKLVCEKTCGYCK